VNLCPRLRRRPPTCQEINNEPSPGGTNNTSRLPGARAAIGAAPSNVIGRMDRAARSPGSQGGGKGVDLCPRLRRRPPTCQEINSKPPSGGTNNTSRLPGASPAIGANKPPPGGTNNTSRLPGASPAIGAAPSNVIGRMDRAARSPVSQGGGKGVDLCPRLRRRPLTCQEIAHEPPPIKIVSSTAPTSADLPRDCPRAAAP